MIRGVHSQECDSVECRDASNAVDGELFAIPGQPAPVAAETKEEDMATGGPWWEVELGGEYEIIAVDVTSALLFNPPSHYPEVHRRREHTESCEMMSAPVTVAIAVLSRL
jgi:hypothetical protein